MSDRTKAFIDISALHHNLRVVKKIAPDSQILAMVKSNAYGHGLVAIGKILSQVDGFGVACIEEAVILRQSGITGPIVIMSGVYTDYDLEQVAEYDLQIVLHDPYQLNLLKRAALAKPLTIWLKLDSGMHRLGFSPSQFREAYDFLISFEKVNKPFVIMTHLADADDEAKETTEKQLESFFNHTDTIPFPKSIANSAGLLAWPRTIADWNRPGIMLYGVSPLLGKIGFDLGLRPVMTLKSKIFAIHHFNKGDAIGYGGRWLCPYDMRVGVVGIGYGDGYPRHARNGTPTLVNNMLCPLVGRVSMDLITVDLTPCPSAKVGDDVVLWGNGLPAEIVANYSDTIAYELVCNVSQRVVFVYQ